MDTMLIIRGGLVLAALSAHCADAQDERWTQAELEKVTAEIQADIETMRGAKFERPVAVHVATKEEFVQYALERMERMETPEKRAADETIFKMLGFIEHDADLMKISMDLLQDQVGGFYDPQTESFYLMDAFTGDTARVILAHELGHALDDQLFSIDGGLEQRVTNTDQSYAYAAVVEGSGTAVMNRWTMEHINEIDLGGVEGFQADAMKSMADAPVALWKPLLGAYWCGAAFLARTDNIMMGQARPAENEDIDAAFREPPRSTEQVLHPDKYWAEETDEPVPIQIEVDKLPRDWEELRRDTVGELMIGILVASHDNSPPVDFANPMALLGLPFTGTIGAGWGGDALVLLGAEDARAMRWVTRWDTERDAAEFYGAMSVFLPSFEARMTALGSDGYSGASLEYGEDSLEVVLDLHYGVEKKSQVRKLFRGLSHSIGADQPK